MPQQISKRTLEFLNTFRNISSSFGADAGRVLTTMSKSGIVIACATVEDTFPHDWYIYDLNEFLSTVNIFGKDATFDFGASAVRIGNETGTSSVMYHYADKKMIKNKPEMIPSNVGDIQYSFTVEAGQLETLFKGGSILGSNVISVHSDGKTPVVLKSHNTKLPCSNFVEVKVGDTYDKLFDLHFSTENISGGKIYPGSYIVSIGMKRHKGKVYFFSKWEHTELPLYYLVSLEHSSHFGELNLSSPKENEE